MRLHGPRVLFSFCCSFSVWSTILLSASSDYYIMLQRSFVSNMIYCIFSGCMPYKNTLFPVLPWSDSLKLWTDKPWADPAHGLRFSVFERFFDNLFCFVSFGAVGLGFALFMDLPTAQRNDGTFQTYHAWKKKNPFICLLFPSLEAYPHQFLNAVSSHFYGNVQCWSSCCLSLLYASIFLALLVSIYSS